MADPNFDLGEAPRSLFTLSDARTDVREDLGLSDSSLLSDADLNRWLNEGQRRLASLLRWYRTFDVMGTTSGTKEYALPDDTSGRCIQIEEIRYDDRQLYPVTLEQLFELDYNYQQSGNGTPDWWYARGGGGFGLHLTPDTTDADILTVLFVALPPDITVDGTKFYVPPGGDEYLLAHAKLRASQKDIYGEGQRRLAEFRTDREEALKEMKRQVDQITERARPVVGGDAMEQSFRNSRQPWHTSIT